MCSKWQKSQITQNHWNNFVKCVRFQDIDSFQSWGNKDFLCYSSIVSPSLAAKAEAPSINQAEPLGSLPLSQSFTFLLVCPRRSASKSVRQNKDGIFNSLWGPLLTRTRYLFWCWKPPPPRQEWFVLFPEGEWSRGEKRKRSTSRFRNAVILVHHTAQKQEVAASGTAFALYLPENPQCTAGWSFNAQL